MGLAATLCLALIGIGAAVFCGWRGARAWDPTRGPRLIPWRPLMLIAAAFSLLMLVHLANLFGVQTGRQVR